MQIMLCLLFSAERLRAYLNIKAPIFPRTFNFFLKDKPFQPVFAANYNNF